MEWMKNSIIDVLTKEVYELENNIRSIDFFLEKYTRDGKKVYESSNQYEVSQKRLEKANTLLLIRKFNKSIKILQKTL